MNIPHHGHVDNIPADWAVEMSCTLGRDGAKPTPRITHFDGEGTGAYLHHQGGSKWRPARAERSAAS
ncbi:hypothetical protein LNP17_12680 [Klebsiella variicola subsp. variicola]|nr:hypothetical protein [Klebsiella variicola subsp. variicola]